MDPKVDSDFNENRDPSRIVMWKSIKLQTFKVEADLANMYFLHQSAKRTKS